MRSAALVPILAMALALPSCQQGGAELSVDNAWVRLPAVAGRPGAAYFTLHGGAAPDRLAGIDSPQAARAELHQGGTMGGMMTMRPMNGVDLPSAKPVSFAPGGDHVMLFGLDPALKPGGTLSLRFHFQSGAARSVDAKLVGAGDPAPAS